MYRHTLFAPIYDAIVSTTTLPFHCLSLATLDSSAASQRILFTGIGSGLDLPELAIAPEYIGIDLTPAMLRRAKHLALQLLHDHPLAPTGWSHFIRLQKKPPGFHK